MKKVPVHLSGFSQNTTFLSLEKYFKNQEKCLKTVKLVLANKFKVKSLDYKLRLQKRKFLEIKRITNFRDLGDSLKDLITLKEILYLIAFSNGNCILYRNIQNYKCIPHLSPLIIFELTNARRPLVHRTRKRSQCKDSALLILNRLHFVNTSMHYSTIFTAVIE